MIDYHTHILPEIDDGAKSVEVSLEMLKILRNQGVKQVIATPHFYAHHEKSVHDFLIKRQIAYEKIGSPEDVNLGAEISIERGISELSDIEKLALQGTNLILLEFPYAKYSAWMENEIHNISAKYNLTPIFAHIHRYLEFFTKEQMKYILQMDAVFQVNNEAFSDFKQRQFVKRLIKERYQIVFGSDCHSFDCRKPNWGLLKKKCKVDAIKDSDEILNSYKVGQKEKIGLSFFDNTY